MFFRQVRAVFAGTLSMMVLAFLIYGVLLTDFMIANQGSAVGGMKEVPIWWALTVGQVLWSYALVYVFERGAPVATFAAGAKVGGLLGLLVAGWWDLMLFATANSMTLTGHLVDAVATAVMSAITGGIVAVVLGMGKKA